MPRLSTYAQKLTKNLLAVGSGGDLLTQISQLKQALERQSSQIERIRRTVMDRNYGGWEFPPAELRGRVGSQDDTLNFWFKGAASSDLVLKHFGADPGQPVLDWGCGSGRTLTWLRCYDGWRDHYHGCDVDGDAIAWLRGRDVPRVEVSGDLPPLPFADGAFGGLFGFSILTHIPPERHRAWYEEFVRVLRPGALALLTTHGAVHAQGSSAEARAAFERTGASYEQCKVPNHYKDSAMVDEAFTRKAVGGLFDVDQFTTRGYLSQDLWLLRRCA